MNEVISRGALLGGCDGFLGVRQCFPERAELGQAVILMAVDLLISQSLGQLMAAIRMGPPS